MFIPPTRQTGVIAGLLLLFVSTVPGPAQTLTWDANTTTTPAQNGQGTWNTSNTNWWDGTTNVSWSNSATSIANIGVLGGTTASQQVITVGSDIQLAQLVFRAIAASTPTSLHQYSLNGDATVRTLDFGTNGLVQIESGASGGSQFLALGANLRLKGENLRFQKYDSGTAMQFINISMTANPDLTGPLTVGGSVYLGLTSPGTLGAASKVVVEAGGSVIPGTAGSTYSQPFELAGMGNSLAFTSTSYGAIRMTASNQIYSGGILLKADAGINTSSSSTNSTNNAITAPITDEGLTGSAFHRFAFHGDGTLLLQAANTYRGATVLGRSSLNYSGSVTVLDFTAATAPQDDILYNNVPTPGALSLFGAISPSVLRLQGAPGETHIQRFGNITVGGTQSSLEIVAGAGGAMNVSVGTITQSDATGAIVFMPGAGGSITSSMAEGFVGPFAAYASSTGQRSWARVVTGGVLSAGYLGDTAYGTGSSLALAPYSATTNLGLTGSSDGDVTTGVTTTNLNTLSMADFTADRLVQTTSGQTLRLGITGGVQLVNGAGNLTLGTTGSSLSAGGTVTNTVGTIFLSNHSPAATLTINSGITNNGTSGLVSLVANGAPGSRTILTGASTFTGGTRISSGILVMQHATALGTTGAINIVENSGTLGLAGGITVARPIVSVAGSGDGGLGAIRNLSGSNTISGLMTLVTNSTITADRNSTLTLSAALPTTSTITGALNLVLGGEGTINVNGRLNLTASASTLTKIGSGLLVLAGDNVHAGATTISAGTLRLAHANALALTSAVTVTSGASLDVNGQPLTRNITLGGAGAGVAGALQNSSVSASTLTGTVAMSVATLINNSGAITIDNAAGITGAVLLTKTGTGTLTIINSTTSVRTGNNQIDGGTLRLQSANAVTAISGLGTGTFVLNSGTLALAYDITNAANTGAVNMLASSGLVADRATSGAGGITHTLGALAIGGSTLTVSAGSNVSSGSIGMTLGAVTIGGTGLIPGNPTFDVRSTSTGALTLTLGALHDQAIAPRTISFLNGGTAASTVVLASAASSLVDGTVVQIGTVGGGPVNLNYNSATALGALSQINVATGSTLALGIAPTAFGSLAGGGAVTGTFNLVVGNAANASNFTSTFIGVLGIGTGTFTKNGKSTLTLGGSDANTFTGLTTVGAGTLILAKTGGALAIPGNLTVGVAAASSQGPATLRLEGSEQIASTATLILNGGSTLNLNGFTQTIGTASTMFGTTITGGGKLILPATAISTITGINTIASGLQIGSDATATRTLTLSSSWDRTTVSGIISQGSAAGLLIKAGNGQLILSGNNSYEGLTTISAGVLNIRHANALGSTVAGTSVAASTTLQIQGGITTAAEPLSLNGAGFGGAAAYSIQNGALVNVSGDNTFVGLVTLAAAATISSDSGSLTLSHTGTITGAFAVTLTGPGNGRIDSVIGTGVGAINKSGTGTWALTGANASTGLLTVSNGTLRLGNGTSGSWTTTPALTLSGLGTFDYRSSDTGSEQGLGALTFSAGDGTVQATYGSSGTSALTFTSLVARTVGATGNFIVSGGENGVSNKITLTGTTTNAFINQGLFYNGTAFAWNDSAGFVRGLTYGSETGAVTSAGTTNLASATHQQITGPLSAQNSATFTTLNIAGNHNINLNAAQTLTVSGLLMTGDVAGGAVISGGVDSAIRAAASTELVFRTAGENDTLTLQVPIIANATNAVTKSGPGLLVLGSGNTYTGATNISGGTLRFTAGGTLTTSGINVRIGGALDLNGQTITNGVAINGNGPTDEGALINSSTTTPAQLGIITMGSATTIGGSGDITSTGALTGGFRLIKTGSGTLTFNVDSARTSPNQIDGGTIRLLTANGMGAASSLLLNGGTLSLGSATTSAAFNSNVTANSGIIVDPATPGAGVSHVHGTLVMNTSTLVIGSGANVTTAATNSGVSFSAATLHGSPTFDVRSPVNAAVGTTTLTLGAINDLGVAQTLTFTNNGASPTNSQIILNANAASLMDGTVINLVSGASAGVTLNLGSATAASNTLGLLPRVNLGAGSILNLFNASPVLGGLSGAGTVTSGTFTLTIGSLNNATPVDSNFTGALTNGAGTLTVIKGGLGTLTLGGNNTFTGATTVSAGILKLASATALTNTSSVVVSNGATLDFNGQSITRNLTFSGTGHSGLGALINTSTTTKATITGTTALGASAKVGGAGNITVSNVTGLTGNVLLTKMGAGKLTFISSVASARSGANQIDEGVLRLQNSTALNVIGAGAMALNGGTLSLGFDSGGTVGGVVNLLSSSTIEVDRATAGDSSHTLTLGALGIGGGTLTVKPGANITSGTAALTLGAATIGGLQLAAGNPTFDVQGSATAAMTLNLGALSDQFIAARSITFQNTDTGTATVNLNANAASLLPGTVVNLSAATGASLTVNSTTATALGAFSQLNLSGASTINLGTSQSFASLNGSGTVTTSATAVLTIGNVPVGTPPDSVFTGTIGGANLSLTKTSNSSLTLGGASTYGGGTTVSRGSLILANTTGSATGTGSVTTLLGTTLGGSGSIVTDAGKSVLIGGTLNVGNSTTASEISITTSGSALLRFDINSALMLDLFSGAGLGNTLQASAADMLAIGGQVSILEGSRLIVGNPMGMTSWAEGDSWRLFDWTSLSAPVSGTFDRVELPTLSSDLLWDLSDLYIGGTAHIVPVIVPEPGRILLVGMGMLLLLKRRRR